MYYIRTMIVGVTGATGHIGYTLCLELVKQGYTVVAFVREYSVELEKLGINIFTGNLLSTESLKAFMSGCEVVIHTAVLIQLSYKEDRNLYNINVIGTKNVLVAAKQMGVKRVIHFSSIHAFCQSPQNVILNEQREFVKDNTLFYDQTKRDGLKLALDAARDGLEVVVLCPTSVIGIPDFRPSKIGKAIIDIYNGSIGAVINGGFNFIDVQEVVKATISAIFHGKSGQIYLLGGEYCTLKQFAQWVLEAKGSKRRLKSVPLVFAYLGVPFVKLYALLVGKSPLYDKPYLDVLQEGNRYVSSQKAIDELGLKITPVKEILFSYVSWLKENKRVK